MDCWLTRAYTFSLRCPSFQITKGCHSARVIRSATTLLCSFASRTQGKSVWLVGRAMSTIDGLNLANDLAIREPKMPLEKPLFTLSVAVGAMLAGAIIVSAGLNFVVFLLGS